MFNVTLTKLLEAGCHFGHKSERWHPKANVFIYTEKDGIHIIDLAITKAALEKAYNFVSELSSNGKEILFVGTKRQAKEIIRQNVGNLGAPYFVERWIGGFMTNWDSIRKNIDKINRLTEEEATGKWKKFPKHEQSKLHRYISKLKVFYGGVLNIKVLPGALFVVDVKKEISAIREARIMGIPVIGIVDTNSDPSLADYVIPANDDATGSISLIVETIVKAIAEGQKVYADNQKKNETTKDIKVDVVPKKNINPVESQTKEVPKKSSETVKNTEPVKKVKTVKKKDISKGKTE
jgi:small subunit ribosomal protein S2